MQIQSFKPSFAAVVHGIYEWDCTDPDTSGQWYVPSERDTSVGAVTTDGGVVNVYSVDTLTDDCYGEVTAIEFCYRYTVSDDGEADGQAYFNWTVFILEDDGSGPFVINNIYTIESRPSLLNSASCTDGGLFTRRCCDTQHIGTFILSMNFAFAITESAQGNTHGAVLLGFPDALPEYRVHNVIQLNKNIFTNFDSLSVGSTLPRLQSLERALRFLWFIVGKY